MALTDPSLEARDDNVKGVAFQERAVRHQSRRVYSPPRRIRVGGWTLYTCQERILLVAFSRRAFFAADRQAVGVTI